MGSVPVPDPFQSVSGSVEGFCQGYGLVDQDTPKATRGTGITYRYA